MEETRKLTLVVVKLVRGVSLELMKQLHDIGVGIGPAEGVAGAVKAKDEIPWGPRRSRVRRLKKGGGWWRAR